MTIKNKQVRMKYVWLISLNMLFVTNTFSQQKYLAIYYFKYTYSNNYHRHAKLVPSLDSADFFRVLLPPSDGDRRFNVQEYYANGKIKLIGKTLSRDTGSMSDAGFIPDGTCANYYPNGKKESQITYVNGHEIGDEYLFFPSGKVYEYFVNKYNDVKWLDCYDINGNQVCNNGTGQWINYDSSYKNIIVQGCVIKGSREGEWKQSAQWPDSISCILIYKKNIVVESYGIDKRGIKYPFHESFVSAYIKGNVPSFIQSVKSRLKLQGKYKNEKALIDTMHMTFVVEKDGSMSHYDVLGTVPDEIKSTIVNAMKLCHGWKPAKLYGVPLKTQLILPMSFKKGYAFDPTADTTPQISGGIVYYRESVYYQNDLRYLERILSDD